MAVIHDIAALALAAALNPAAISPQIPPRAARIDVGQPGYAVLAERILASPAIVDATVRSATRLKPAEAPGVAPDRARFYIEADVTTLIRGTAAIPQRITYLADVALDARGKPPKLKKQRVLLFARPVAGRAGEIQLTAPDAQWPWTPGLDARVRAIATEVVAPDAPPAITGVGNAFHVAGTLPGEGETQVFLATANQRPVSISILRRPGEQTRWAVSLAEIVDESAGPPVKDSLLWYRLACGLPRALPDRSTAAMEAADAAIAREDYQFVLASLGPCGA